MFVIYFRLCNYADILKELFFIVLVYVWRWEDFSIYSFLRSGILRSNRIGVRSIILSFMEVLLYDLGILV